jgi:hypothetical protein
VVAGVTACSLHLGLNYVAPAAYGGWDGELAGCHLDAEAMADLALRNGWFVTDVLLDRQATGAALAERMEGFAALLNAGDRLLLTYSGHGGQVRDKDGDEDDGKDETWCLWDGELIDDRIGAMLAKFRPGVRITVVSDSCHSGTVTRARRARPIAALPDPEINILRASGLLFSGCSDEQLSGDLPIGGKFTTTMLAVLRGLPPGAGWRTLHHQVLQLMPKRQQPQLSFSGPLDPAFVDERPFSI